MTRDEAIAFLKAHGISAEQRSWAMGDTIEVPLGSAKIHTGITAYPDVLWLLEDGVPLRWYLVRIIQQRESRTEFQSLEAACAAAADLAKHTEPAA
jgi:hypothetical protein